MPSPVGHSLAGVAVVWLADLVWPVKAAQQAPSVAHNAAWQRVGGRLALVAGLLAAAPDLDLVIRSHRTFTHSVGAAIVVMLVAAIVAWRQRLPVLRTSLICSLACATHVVLDWVAADRATPPGIMALWPFNSTFYHAPITLFPNVSRNYWLPGQFIFENTIALICELVVVGIPVALLWRVRVKTLAALPPKLPSGNHPAE